MKIIDIYEVIDVSGTMRRKKVAEIQFDGKAIIVESDSRRDKDFYTDLISKDKILPKETDERFKLIPERFSNTSRIIFSDVREG